MKRPCFLTFLRILNRIYPATGSCGGTALIALLASTLFAHGIPPAWWSHPDSAGNTVVVPGADAEPLATANIGQAKYMAKRALDALRAAKPEAATEVEILLVGPGKPIPSWLSPVPAESNYAPLLIGQLKAIAAPFYKTLRNFDSEWLLSQMAENGTTTEENLDNYFPWTTVPEDDSNLSVATIGQLKAVFSLRFETIGESVSGIDEAVDDDIEIVVEPGDSGVFPAPGPPPPPSNPEALRAFSTSYEIFYQRGSKTFKKYGYKPIFQDDTNRNVRYLNMLQRYIPIDGSSRQWIMTIPDQYYGGWRVGYMANGYPTFGYYQSDFKSHSINRLTGSATKGGRSDLYTGWENTPDDQPNLNNYSRATHLNVQYSEFGYFGNFVDRMGVSNKLFSQWYPFPDGQSFHWFLDFYADFYADRNTERILDTHPFDLLGQYSSCGLSYEKVVYNENTMARVKELALDRNNAPGFGGWQKGSPWAKWDEGDRRIVYSRFRISLKQKEGATPRPTKILVVFTPKNGGPSQILKEARWDGKGTHKTIEVDPVKLKRGIEGDFHVALGTIALELDTEQANDRNDDGIVIVADNESSTGGRAAETSVPLVMFPGKDSFWFDGNPSIRLTKISGSGAGTLSFKAWNSNRTDAVNVPLGADLTNNFFKEGGTYTNYTKWEVNGESSGNVKMQLEYKKGSVTMIVKRGATVISGDLDVDSNNTSVVESTIAEEQIENDLKNKPGKIITSSREAFFSPGGIPQNLNGLVDLVVDTSGVTLSDKIMFNYPGGHPSVVDEGAAKVERPLRIWRRSAGGLPTTAGAYVVPGQAYTLSQLGFQLGQRNYLYLQGYSGSVARKVQVNMVISKNDVEVEDTVAVTLVPVEINSLDKYVDIRIPDSGVAALGGADLRMTLTSPGGQPSQTQVFNIGLATAKIYERTDWTAAEEGVFFPRSEAETSAANPDDPAPLNAWSHDETVAPIAVSRENGYYRFVTCFDKVGPIKVAVASGTSHRGVLDYTLTQHVQMEELIDQLETVFQESFAYRFAGFPEDPEDPPLGALAAPGGGPSFLAFGWPKILHRNLVAKCCSAVFDKVKTTVKQGVALYVDGVTVAVVGAQGFCQGFWAGVKSDAQAVADFVKMVRHPIDTGKSLYEGFRSLCDMSLDQLKAIPKKMLEEYLTDAQKNIAWADPSGLHLIAYTVGYSAGYLTEQILVSVLAGPLKAFQSAVVVSTIVCTGGKVAKMMSAVKTGQKLLGVVEAGKDAVAKIQKAKNLATKACTQFVTDKAGLDKIELMVKRTLAAGCATN
jgi:hypothetical protein